MKTELIIINPEEFGLKQEQGEAITKGLKVILDERKVLSEQYKTLMKSEINEETIQASKKLRILIRDNRTKGIEKWHEANKAYWLAGGKFVDAVRRKEIVENEFMEENLLKNENHFDNIEKERLDKLEKQRKELLLEEFPDVNFGASDLRNMTQEHFIQLWNDQCDLKELREAKLAKELADVAASEQEAQLSNERFMAALEYKKYIDDFDNRYFGDLEKDVFDEIISDAIKLKEVADKKLADTEAENKRLKDEADKKSAEETERISKENVIKELQTKRLTELLPFNIPANNKIDLNKLGEHKEEDYQRILANKKVDWQKLQDDQKAIADKADADKKATEELAAKIQKELDDKKAAEEKLAKQKLEDEAAKLKMCDVEKWDELKEKIKNIFAEIEFKSDVYQKRSKLLKNTNAAVLSADINQPITININ